MRLATKLRRAVTVSTATGRMRQKTLAGYERKFRETLRKIKTVSAVLDKVCHTSTQHTLVYNELTNAIVDWSAHGKPIDKKNKKKKTKKKVEKKEKKATTRSSSPFRRSRRTEEAKKEPVVEVEEPNPLSAIQEESSVVITAESECEKISKLIQETGDSYAQDYKNTVKTTLQEWQNQVATVLRTMIAKTRLARDHLEHYERKVETLRTQLNRLQQTNSTAATTVALDKCKLKVERNLAKRDKAHMAHEEYMKGLEQCSVKLDQIAMEIWPMMNGLLTMEKSYTTNQLTSIQQGLLDTVSLLLVGNSDTATVSPSLHDIMTSAISTAQEAAPAEPLSYIKLVDPQDEQDNGSFSPAPPPPPSSTGDEGPPTPRTDHRTKRISPSSDDDAIVLPSLKTDMLIPNANSPDAILLNEDKVQDKRSPFERPLSSHKPKEKEEEEDFCEDSFIQVGYYANPDEEEKRPETPENETAKSDPQFDLKDMEPGAVVSSKLDNETTIDSVYLTEEDEPEDKKGDGEETNDVVTADENEMKGMDPDGDILLQKGQVVEGSEKVGGIIVEKSPKSVVGAPTEATETPADEEIVPEEGDTPDLSAEKDIEKMEAATVLDEDGPAGVDDDTAADKEAGKDGGAVSEDLGKTQDKKIVAADGETVSVDTEVTANLAPQLRAPTAEDIGVLDAGSKIVEDLYHQVEI